MNENITERIVVGAGASGRAGEGDANTRLSSITGRDAEPGPGVCAVAKSEGRKSCPI